MREMNTQQLREKLYHIEKISYGTWRITVRHRRRKSDKYSSFGWKYVDRYTTHITHDACAIDRLKDHGYIPDRAVNQFYTYRQALAALVNNK